MLCLWTVHVKIIFIASGYFTGNGTQYASSWCPPPEEARGTCGIDEVHHAATTALDAAPAAFDAAVAMTRDAVDWSRSFGVVPEPVGFPIVHDDIPTPSYQPTFDDVPLAHQCTFDDASPLASSLSYQCTIDDLPPLAPTISYQCTIDDLPPLAPTLPYQCTFDDVPPLAPILPDQCTFDEAPPFAVHSPPLTAEWPVPATSATTQSTPSTYSVPLLDRFAHVEIDTPHTDSALSTSKVPSFDHGLCMANEPPRTRSNLTDLHTLDLNASSLFVRAFIRLFAAYSPYANSAHRDAAARVFAACSSFANSAYEFVVRTLIRLFAAYSSYASSAYEFATAILALLDPVMCSSSATSLHTKFQQFAVVGRDLLSSSLASWMSWVCDIARDYTSAATTFASQTASALWDIACDHASTATTLASQTASTIWDMLAPCAAAVNSSVSVAYEFIKNVLGDIESFAAEAPKYSPWIFCAFSIFVFARLVMVNWGAIADTLWKIRSSCVEWWWSFVTWYYNEAAELLFESICDDLALLHDLLFTDLPQSLEQLVAAVSGDEEASDAPPVAVGVGQSPMTLGSKMPRSSGMKSASSLCEKAPSHEGIESPPSIIEDEKSSDASAPVDAVELWTSLELSSRFSRSKTTSSLREKAPSLACKQSPSIIEDKKSSDASAPVDAVELWTSLELSSRFSRSKTTSSLREQASSPEGKKNPSIVEDEKGNDVASPVRTVELGKSLASSSPRMPLVKTVSSPRGKASSPAAPKKNSLTIIGDEKARGVSPPSDAVKLALPLDMRTSRLSRVKTASLLREKAPAQTSKKNAPLSIVDKSGRTQKPTEHPTSVDSRVFAMSAARADAPPHVANVESQEESMPGTSPAASSCAAKFELPTASSRTANTMSGTSVSASLCVAKFELPKMSPTVVSQEFPKSPISGTSTSASSHAVNVELSKMSSHAANFELPKTPPILGTSTSASSYAAKLPIPTTSAMASSCSVHVKLSEESSHSANVELPKPHKFGWSSTTTLSAGNVELSKALSHAANFALSESPMCDTNARASSRVVNVELSDASPHAMSDEFSDPLLSIANSTGPSRAVNLDLSQALSHAVKSKPSELLMPTKSADASSHTEVSVASFVATGEARVNLFCDADLLENSESDSTKTSHPTHNPAVPSHSEAERRQRFLAGSNGSSGTQRSAAHQQELESTPPSLGGHQSKLVSYQAAVLVSSQCLAKEVHQSQVPSSGTTTTPFVRGTSASSLFGTTPTPSVVGANHSVSLFGGRPAPPSLDDHQSQLASYHAAVMTPSPCPAKGVRQTQVLSSGKAKPPFIEGTPAPSLFNTAPTPSVVRANHSVSLFGGRPTPPLLGGDQSQPMFSIGAAPSSSQRRTNFGNQTRSLSTGTTTPSLAGGMPPPSPVGENRSQSFFDNKNVPPFLSGRRSQLASSGGAVFSLQHHLVNDTIRSAALEDDAMVDDAPFDFSPSKPCTPGESDGTASTLGSNVREESVAPRTLQRTPSKQPPEADTVFGSGNFYSSSSKLAQEVARYQPVALVAEVEKDQQVSGTSTPNPKDPGTASTGSRSALVAREPCVPWSLGKRTPPFCPDSDSFIEMNEKGSAAAHSSWGGRYSMRPGVPKSQRESDSDSDAPAPRGWKPTAVTHPSFVRNVELDELERLASFRDICCEEFFDGLTESDSDSDSDASAPPPRWWRPTPVTPPSRRVATPPSEQGRLEFADNAHLAELERVASARDSALECGDSDSGDGLDREHSGDELDRERSCSSNLPASEREEASGGSSLKSLLKDMALSSSAATECPLTCFK